MVWNFVYIVDDGGCGSIPGFWILPGSLEVEKDFAEKACGIAGVQLKQSSLQRESLSFKRLDYSSRGYTANTDPPKIA